MIEENRMIRKGDEMERKRGFEIITSYQDKGINIPKRSTKHSAGYDFEAAETIVLPLKHFLVLPNGVGVVDSDYYNNEGNEGHIYFQLLNFGLFDKEIQKGDRIGQGIFHSFLKADEDDVEEANERTGGFGSSGVR